MADGRTVTYREPRQPATVIALYLSEDRDILFDFSKAPEIVAGVAIAAAEVEGGIGLTLGEPVLSGPVVRVRTSGAAAADYPIAVVATLGSGRKLALSAVIRGIPAIP